MHPLRKLRESGKPTAAQISELLAENIVFNSPILARPIGAPAGRGAATAWWTRAMTVPQICISMQLHMRKLQYAAIQLIL